MGKDAVRHGSAVTPTMVHGGRGGSGGGGVGAPHRPARPPAHRAAADPASDPRSGGAPGAGRHRRAHRGEPVVGAGVDRRAHRRAARGPARAPTSTSSIPTTTSSELLCHDDLVAIGAAGGDGTLAAVATIAAERDVPFVAVPAGHAQPPRARPRPRDRRRRHRGGASRARRRAWTSGSPATAASSTRSPSAATRRWSTRASGSRTASASGRRCSWRSCASCPAMEPLRVELDGEPRRVWLAWIGNCRYDPTGFGPSWREHLDDGLLDVRIVNGARRFSRTRFTLDVLAGRLRQLPRLRGAPGRVAVDPVARRPAAPGRRRGDLRRTGRARGHQAASGLAGGGAARPGAQQRPPQHHQQRRPAPPRRPR